MESNMFACQICNKKYSLNVNLRRHMKTKHPKQRIDPSKIKLSTEKMFNIPSKMVKCPKCDYTLGHENYLKQHTAEYHSNKTYKHVCFICLKPFYTKSMLINHINVVHTSTANSGIDPYPKMNSEGTPKPFVFEHPFSMIVAGPSRSGKTYWVIDLLANANERIKPTPMKIIYCYSHWQHKYEILKEQMSNVQWHEGLPTKPFMDDVSDAILVLDDLMAEGVNNPTLMDVFTKGSHHKNISVILLMQNIFHQGTKARSMQLNTQYMVLFKNPHDRQQIKIIAMRMYPQNWRGFLEKFEHETRKAYGKVIIDLRPNTEEENRIVKSSNIGESQLFKNVLNQQRQQMEYTNPYLAEALDEKKHIDSILSDPSINNSEKQTNYQEAMDNYMTYIKKSEKNPALTGLPYSLPFKLEQQQQQQQQALFPQKPASSSSSLQPDQPFSSKLVIPHYQPLPSSSTLSKKDVDMHHFSAAASNNDYFGSMEDIISLPVTRNDDISLESGNKDHMRHFVSLSDDEDKRVNTKSRQAPYRFRDRTAKRRKDQFTKKPYKNESDSD